MDKLETFTEMVGSGADPFFAVMCGQEKSAQDVLTREIVGRCQRPEYTRTVVFSPNQSSFYKGMVPEDSVYSNLTLSAFESTIWGQKSQAVPVRPRLLIVLDECDTWLRSTAALFLFFHSRSMNTSLVLTNIKHTLHISFVIRQQMDYGFFFQDKRERERNILFRDFFGFVSTRERFYDILDKCTSTSDCLVLEMDTCALFHHSPSPTGPLDRTIERLEVYKEELAQVTWHPSRLVQCGEECALDSDSEQEHSNQKSTHSWPNY